MAGTLTSPLLKTPSPDGAAATATIGAAVVDVVVGWTIVVTVVAALAIVVDGEAAMVGTALTADTMELTVRGVTAAASDGRTRARVVEGPATTMATMIAPATPTTTNGAMTNGLMLGR